MSAKTRFVVLAVGSLLALAVLACNASARPAATQPVAIPTTVNVETLLAQASLSPLAPSPAAVSATPAGAASETPVPAGASPIPPVEASASPANAGASPANAGASPTSTVTPSLTPTQTATWTATAGCSMGVQLIADVTLPGYAKIVGGDPQQKIWRFQNVGACAWEPGTQLVFVSGYKFSSVGAIAVPSMPPGTVVDLTLNFKAPVTVGAYRSNWQMQTPGGQRFGSVFSIVVDVIAPTAVPSKFENGWRIYGPGSKGAGVYAIQYLLTEEGYSVTINGKYDDETEDAVRDFQKDKGITKNGTVGSKTWTALISGHTLSIGDSGAAVKAAQRLLNAYDADLKVDGDFDDDVEEAVRDFQDEYELSVDGVIGSKTWKALVANQ